LSTEQQAAMMDRPKRLSREEARQSLPENLRATYDSLCDQTIEWSSARWSERRYDCECCITPIARA